jgi:hypothetical protein
LLRCKEPSRIKWRRQFITALHNRLVYLETDFSLEETLYTVVEEWLETESVNISKYPTRFHQAIQSQSLIGWRHLLSGKISQEWLKLQETSTKVTIGRKRLSYVWGASLAKVLLKQFIKLWELRNEEVHGKTAELQEQIRKDKLGKVVRQLNELRDQARPSDMCLFHSDMKAYIEKSNAQSIASYISSHKKAIANSIKEWAGASHVGIASIVDWIRNNNSSEQIDRIYSRQRRGLLNESRNSKSKKGSRENPETSINSRILHSEQTFRLNVDYSGGSNKLLRLRVTDLGPWA